MSDAFGQIAYGFWLATGFAAILFAGLLLVTDDEVIEQWQVEHVGGGAQSQREPRIVRARRRRHALGE